MAPALGQPKAVTALVRPGGLQHPSPSTCWCGAGIAIPIFSHWDEETEAQEGHVAESPGPPTDSSVTLEPGL